MNSLHIDSRSFYLILLYKFSWGMVAENYYLDLASYLHMKEMGGSSIIDFGYHEEASSNLAWLCKQKSRKYCVNPLHLKSKYIFHKINLFKFLQNNSFKCMAFFGRSGGQIWNFPWNCSATQPLVKQRWMSLF